MRVRRNNRRWMREVDGEGLDAIWSRSRLRHYRQGLRLHAAHDPAYATKQYGISAWPRTS